MNLPFVSRGRFDDALQQIKELKAELAEAKKERKLLADVIGVKAVGFSIYGELAIPKDEDEPEPKGSEKDSPERPDFVPTRARDVVRHREKENLQQYSEDEQASGRLKSIAAEEVRKAVEAGRHRAVEVPTNGNH